MNHNIIPIGVSFFSHLEIALLRQCLEALALRCENRVSLVTDVRKVKDLQVGQVGIFLYENMSTWSSGKFVTLLKGIILSKIGHSP